MLCVHFNFAAILFHFLLCYRNIHRNVTPNHKTNGTTNTLNFRNLKLFMLLNLIYILEYGIKLFYILYNYRNCVSFSSN